MKPGIREIALCAAAVLLALAAWPAPSYAQPTPEQQDAIKQSCRSDYISNCMSVKPGGIEALQCLKRNSAKLSGACRTAVSAVSMPGEAKPAPAAAAPAPVQQAAPPPAAAPAPQPAPSVAAPAAPVASPPPAAAAPKPVTPPSAASAPRPAAPSAAAKPQTPPPSRPKPATAAAAPAASAPAQASAQSAAPAQPSSPPTLLELRKVQLTCGNDIAIHCKGTPPGEGRIVACLSAREPALSPGCKQAVAEARR